jgi:hypothetical protein
VCLILNFNSVVAFGFEIAMKNLQLHLFTGHSAALHSIALEIPISTFQV